ncbi:PRD domain-containing protein [Brenneria izadpanahii]|uniref:PRD domain-containing protein n=1 Tax=Brenneria izadpanahii TaxID=2722756 RepID=A0ABX7UW38_9GAMM|nr:PRD domain-containing protein [Brenneria izadpanahii]QTF09996.1 PRD domain-containing protein [Brenneria izadpanahii]
MKVIKTLSHNAVLAVDEQGQEIVAIGRGIGFGKKTDDEIDAGEIKSWFIKSGGPAQEIFLKLMKQIPTRYLMLTQEILDHAKDKITITQYETVFITLSDHINYAIQRQQEGKVIRNFLLWDIRRFYPNEYLIGLDALKLIETRLGVALPEDEAGFIAMHLANASHDGSWNETMLATEMIKDILNIIKFELFISFHEEDVDYQRLITHLRFFTLRVLKRRPVDHKDLSIYQGINEMMPKAHHCALKIADYMKEKHSYKLTIDEIMFLTIHINRIMHSS